MKYYDLKLFSRESPLSRECSTSSETNAEDNLFPPASWCIHKQNMLLWAPHGRFLLACLLNNQLFSGLSVAARRATRHAQGTLGALDAGMRVLFDCCICLSRDLWGCSGRRVETVSGRYPWWWCDWVDSHDPLLSYPSPISFPLQFYPFLFLCFMQQLPEGEWSLKTATVIIPKHILVIYAWLHRNLRQFIILFPIFLFLICWCLAPLDFNL